MSLIQEALRRQKEETEGKTSPAQETATPASPPPPLRLHDTPPPPSPATPPPPDTAPSAAATAHDGTQETAHTRPAWTSVLGIAIVVLILLAGSAWLLSFAYQQWRVAHGGGEAPTVTVSPPAAAVPRRPSAPPSVEPPVPTPTVAAEPPAVTAPTSTATVAASTAIVATSTAIVAVVPAPSPLPPPVAAATVPVASTTAPPVVASTPATASATQAVQTAPQPKLPVEWPLLALKGVIGRGAGGSAIINDQVVAVNEAVDGVVVMAVKNQGVELEYKGEKRFLKVGTATR
jgi:hypothetical protein